MKVTAEDFIPVAKEKTKKPVPVEATSLKEKYG